MVQQLELRRLVSAASRADALVVLRVGVSDRVYPATPVADLRGGDLPDHVVQAAVIRGVERSFDQDPMLGMRLLADIGLRGLSPAVNDPATAVEAIDAIESLLRELADRQLAIPDISDAVGVPRVRLILPTWEDYVRTGIDDLVPAAAGTPMVVVRLLRLVTTVRELSPPPRQAAIIPWPSSSRLAWLSAGSRPAPPQFRRHRRAEPRRARALAEVFGTSLCDVASDPKPGLPHGARR